MLLIEETQTSEREALAELVLAAQEGDRLAFGTLVERFQRAVYATALRHLGNHAEAQELAQEVFVQALKRIGQLREPARFGGWLKTITVRLAIDRAVRRRPVAATEPSVMEDTCVERKTPLDLALARERAGQVRAGLKRLSTLDRETLEAFYVRGESLLEMSDSFRSPVGTIKRRLHVARKRLAETLAE